MLNSLRDSQINYGTTNCPSVHVPPHNVAAPIHQNSLISTEPTTPVYPWNSNPRFEHLYGFHSRYYNLDYPTPYPPATNQYVPANMYGQNVPQCCQPCCRLRSHNIPKKSPPQVLYNSIRPVQQLNRSYKSKKTLKTPCSEQFLPYIPNDLPIKYDTQNCYQQKYSSSYINNTNYCPPANNLWIPPATNHTWSTDRLRPIGCHTVSSQDFSGDKNYQRLPNYQSNSYPNPTGATHHRPYNYIPPIPEVHDYRPSVYHNSLKNNTPEYIYHEQNSRLPISSQNNQSSSLQQYYSSQPESYSDKQRPCESFNSPELTPQNSSKSNLNVREFLSTWDEGEEEINEKSSETTAPIVVLDCMTLEGDALTKIQEKLNVVSYENLEKVLKENPLAINTEPNEIDSIHNKVKPLSKSNFEPLDYTKRETGIIKPFNTEKKTSPEINNQPEKSYSVNFDGMVAWYGKKNTDISSTDLIERLADRIFNLSKSQENEGVSFGTAAYTGQITQTHRSIENSSKYIQNQQMFDLHQTEKCGIEPSVINKIDGNSDTISKNQSCILNENHKASIIKSNNINSSCIVENKTKTCLNVSNEQITPWNLNQVSQEHHLNLSLYDHNVNIKPLDFSSLTDETKGNIFAFEKSTASDDKPNENINDQYDKVLNDNNNYNSTVSINQHSIQQIGSSDRNFPVIVSPHRQEYNGFHESVIQRTGCDKNKHDKVQTQTDFESMNWSISNDLDKIMKNTNLNMEQSCLYDRNNYNILDSMSSDKNVSTQWKNNVPCIDLTVNTKTVNTNSNHDSFFDGWNFIDNYDSHYNKKYVNPSNSNVVHDPLFLNQTTSLEESNNKKNNSRKKVENEALITQKDIPFSKSNDVSSNNVRPRDVFNLNNRIPDFNDGSFELPIINEHHEYMPFKKSSNDNEHRTDGSIFEHLTEPKCIRTSNETTNTKIDQNKFDMVGLPSFKEKEPLAPMPVPSKLNIVKPIVRDPSQTYTVIKQKLKYNNTCFDNENLISNKTDFSLRGNQMSAFNGMDLKSKYNNVQLNQFDVWSEKFVLKSNSNNSSNAVVQCDVEITQFKSTPENRNTFISKPNISENNQDKSIKLTDNTNCNLTVDKISAIENDKIHSNDFLNCLESTKTDDQKYRDTLDEFETSFGFDIHCNNESSKSFHEEIVDKCLEERIKDQIGEHNINTSDSINTSKSITSSPNNTQLPFQCDFQSGYLTKNDFSENKNKTVLYQKQPINHEKSVTSVFNYHNGFELQSNNILATQNSDKNSDFNILNDVNCDIVQIRNDTADKTSNFINQTESFINQSFKSDQENINNRKLCIDKNSFDYLTIDNRSFEFENTKKNILDSTSSKEILIVNNPNKPIDVHELNKSDSDIHKLNNNNDSNVQKTDSSLNNDFELSINKSNIFVTNSNTTSVENATEYNENHELENKKINFASTFHSENAENIECHTNSKNIFELENSNSGMYQTQDLEKMHEFDFETRIIQSFEIDCSISNVQEPTSPKEICSNKTNYVYEIDNKENNLQKETNFKSSSCYEEELQTKETTELVCNGNKQFCNKIEINNVYQENKIDRIFEVGCIANNIQDKSVSKLESNFDIQSKNTNEISHNNLNTHKNSNAKNKVEVEIITMLNTKKCESYVSENCSKVDDKQDVSKSQENIKGQSMKVNKSENINGNCEKTKLDDYHDESNETFEETDNVILQEFVNSSDSSSMANVLQQNDPSLDEKSEEIVLKDMDKPDKYAPNKNENLQDIFNKSLRDSHSEDTKKNEVESANSNNLQSIKNEKFNTAQGEATKKMFDNIKSDLLTSVVINIDNTRGENHNQNNCSGPRLLNNVELTHKRNVDDIVDPEGSPKSELCLINHVDITCHQHSVDIVEVKNLSVPQCNSLNQSVSTYQLHSDDNVKVENISKSELGSLNHRELTCQQNFDDIAEVEDLPVSQSSSLNLSEFTCKLHCDDNLKEENLSKTELSSLNHCELTYRYFDDIVNVKDSHKSVPNKLDYREFNYQQHSDKIVEYSNSMNGLVLSENNDLETSDDTYLKNVISKSIVDDVKLPRVKFILKSSNKTLIKRNIFDEESMSIPHRNLSTVKNKTFIARKILKKRNYFSKRWRNLYKKSVDESGENSRVVETICPPITTSVYNVSHGIKLLDLDDIEEKKDSKVVASLVASTFFNEEQYVKNSARVETKNDSNSAFYDNVDDDSYKPFTHEELTPMPSPLDDFLSENDTPEHCDSVEYWDKSLENEYKNVLHRTISKLTKNRVNIRDKFNIRLLARRTNEMKQRKRRRRFNQQTRRVVDDDLTGDIVVVEVPSTTKTTNQRCKIKVQLPWGRIFNLSNQKVEDQQKMKDTKLELGPAKVEVRLSRTPGEWQVAACQSMTSPKSVVSVRRLVLQKATSPNAKDFDHSLSKTISNSVRENCCSSGDSCSSNDLQECSRKLPKIVIRRNGQDNNYTSYVSSGFEGGDNDDGAPQLMVRLVRDRKLDAMAADGVTTLHLKHLVPISESAADTHDAKRVRYT